MSTKKLKKIEFVESVLSEIRTKYGLKNDSEVAEFLGYSSTGTLANWKKKGRVNFNRIHEYCRDLDLSGLKKNEKTHQVNTERLYSYDPEIPKTAPVKEDSTNMVNDDPVPYQINPKSDVIQMLDAAEVLIRAARRALENHNNK